jgi:cephalosporin-C deacetylase-like acetyl esterase
VPRDIEFNAEGLTLRGWFYVPDGAKKPVPTIVMAHGFSCTKEMFLDKYAEVFVKDGLAVLIYDNRNFGDSDGQPRLEVDPYNQIRDYRHAITYASSLPEVDSSRIGIWGTSYTGGHVLQVAAIDKRVKCVVSQVPVVSGYRNAHRAIAEDHARVVGSLCGRPAGPLCR